MNELRGFFFRNWYSTSMAGCVGNRSIVIREWNNLVAQLRSDLIEKEHPCNLSPFLMLLFPFFFFFFKALPHQTILDFADNITGIISWIMISAPEMY